MKSSTAAQEELLAKLRQIKRGLTETKEVLESEDDGVRAHQYIKTLENDLDDAEVLLARWEISRTPLLRRLWDRVKKIVHPQPSE